jgi:hypothetical protein
MNGAYGEIKKVGINRAILAHFGRVRVFGSLSDYDTLSLRYHNPLYHSTAVPNLHFIHFAKNAGSLLL